MIEILIKDGNKCKIVGEVPIQIVRDLDQELSFDVKGAEYSYYYKVKGWDGKKRLLSNKLEFPYGLLRRVKSFLDKNNTEYSIIDRRNKLKVDPLDISEALKKIEKIPRDYQLEAANKVLENDIGIIKVATGGGKTLIAALMIANLNKPTNVYVIGKDLLYQFHDLFKAIFNEEIGIIGDGHCEIRRINVVSVWSVGEVFGEKLEPGEIDIDELLLGKDKETQLKECLQKAKVNIFDECQATSCATIQNISKEIEPQHIYGMSASPWRDDGSDLLIESILGHRLIDISASLLIERGFLVQPIIKFVKVPKPTKKIKKHYQTIYKEYIVENDVRNNLVIDQTVRLVEKGYKVLLLFRIIKHGDSLFKMLKDKGVKCCFLSGKDSIEIRNAGKEGIMSGKFDVIVGSLAFATGFDLIKLDGIVLATSFRSSLTTIQAAGRCLRLCPGKKFAAIVDFDDDVPFLKEHVKERKRIYLTEPKFIIK